MLKILLIDDATEFRETMEEILTDKYFYVTTAQNTEEGLNRLNEAFDLICVDFNMPGRNGYGFCREIRTNPEFRMYSRIPIIGIGDFPEDKREYLCDCFNKPFNLASFFYSIEKIVFGEDL